MFRCQFSYQTVRGSLPNQHFILLQCNVECILQITMCPLQNTIAVLYLFVQFQVIDMLHVNKAWTRLRINGCEKAVISRTHEAGCE